MREKGINFLFQLMHRRIDFAGDAFDELQLLVREVVSRQARHRFDAADTGGDGAFADDAEQADLARRARVRAAAKFHRIAVERRSEERRVGKECRSRWSPY